MFNSLDIMENSSVLEELKFGEGDGNLHYYFYNFKCPEISPDRVSAGSIESIIKEREY